MKPYIKNELTQYFLTNSIILTMKRFILFILLYFSSIINADAQQAPPSVSTTSNSNSAECKQISDAILKEIEMKNYKTAENIYFREVANVINKCSIAETNNLNAKILGLMKDNPAIKSELPNILNQFMYNFDFRLAFDKVKQKYGFLDANLKLKIPFVFDEAIPFKTADFTTGKYKGVQVLIDTFGKSYKLATDLNQLDKTTQALVLPDGKVETLPENIGDFKKLEIIIIRNNLLKELPLSLGQLTELRYIDLYYNRLTGLPKEIGQLKKLKNLLLPYNLMTELPKEIGGLTELTELNLLGSEGISFDSKLQNIPEEIGNLGQLKILELSCHKLKNLPKSIGNLKELERLDVSKNWLEELPKEIGNLTNLKYFDLKRNRLKELPKEIGDLKNVQGIFLSENQLIELPKTIGNLNKLINLYLDDNKLTGLPDEIGLLKDLIRLFLHKNQITKLPNSIGNLKQLRDLELSYNQLTELPMTLCNTIWALNQTYPYGEITNNPVKLKLDCPRENVMFTIAKQEEISPSGLAKEAAQNYFSKKNYKETFKSALLSVRLDSIHHDKFFNLSFYALFAGEYKQAINAAKMSIALNPSAIDVETNLALGYLLDNQYAKAEAIYKKWKGKKFVENAPSTATVVFLQDIKDLETAGVIPKNRLNDVERIKKFLNE